MTPPRGPWHYDLSRQWGSCADRSEDTLLQHYHTAPISNSTLPCLGCKRPPCLLLLQVDLRQRAQRLEVVLPCLRCSTFWRVSTSLAMTHLLIRMLRMSPMNAPQKCITQVTSDLLAGRIKGPWSLLNVSASAVLIGTIGTAARITMFGLYCLHTFLLM